MQLKNILHVAVRTMDIDATNKFYAEVLRMQVDPNRPDSIPAPGTWLNFGDCQIHVIAGPKAYGEFDPKTKGGGNLDHMAIRAVGFDAWKEHLTKHGVDYRQNNVRALGQWQLFIRDPNGIVIELQFIVANEPAGSKGPDGTKPYMFGYF
jgi:catechol 2,3-dioxygenase-like lactoylglutathione lyase family enzyme